MAFDLLQPTTEARIIRAALTLELFTIPQLARFTGINVRTLRSVFIRRSDHFEMHPAQLRRTRGARCNLYQLTAAARTAYHDQLRLPQAHDNDLPQQFLPMMEVAAMSIAAAEDALERKERLYATSEERMTYFEAAWSHCKAGDQALQTASRLARSAHQRTIVAKCRVRALRALKRMIHSMPPSPWPIGTI
jgi:hypothetical protein